MISVRWLVLKKIEAEAACSLELVDGVLLQHLLKTESVLAALQMSESARSRRGIIDGNVRMRGRGTRLRRCRMRKVSECSA